MVQGVAQPGIATNLCEGQLVERKDYAQELAGSGIRPRGDPGAAAGRSDILRRVVADWRSKNEALNERFRTEYGWGEQGRVSDQTYGFVGKDGPTLPGDRGESVLIGAERGGVGVSVGPDGVYATRTKLVETGLRNIDIKLEPLRPTRRGLYDLLPVLKAQDH